MRAECSISSSYKYPKGVGRQITTLRGRQEERCLALLHLDSQETSANVAVVVELDSLHGESYAEDRANKGKKIDGQPSPGQGKRQTPSHRLSSRLIHLDRITVGLLA